MFSDIFYLDRSKVYTLSYYNIKLFETIFPILTKAELNKIKRNCLKNINLLTYDILALLNVYKHFIEHPTGISYVNQTGENFKDTQYVYEIYLNKQHLFLKNYFTILSIIESK